MLCKAIRSKQIVIYSSRALFSCAGYKIGKGNQPDLSYLRKYSSITTLLRLQQSLFDTNIHEQNNQTYITWLSVQQSLGKGTIHNGCETGWKELLNSALLWRHNGRGSVSNHQPRDCLLNRLFRCGSKKTSKLRVTGLCAGNSPETGEFPAQMASNAENDSIWWRHHGIGFDVCFVVHFTCAKIFLKWSWNAGVCYKMAV